MAAIIAPASAPRGVPTGGPGSLAAMRVLGQDDPLELDDDLVVLGDNAAVLPRLPDGAFDLVYIDPPFNTGRRQRHARVTAVPDAAGPAGFGGRRYARQVADALAYDDRHADYLEWIGPRLEHARRLLAPHGTLYLHLDPRESHYCKVLLDGLFGRECFLNEIVWVYDFGGRSTRRWPAKHPRAPRARQAADLGVVAHHRPDERCGADGLPDPEARGDRPADGGRLVAAGRVVPGLLRGVGHPRGRLPGPRAPLRARRRAPRRRRGHARPAGLIAGQPACASRHCTSSRSGPRS
jgi:hypothetical protein